MNEMVLRIKNPEDEIQIDLKTGETDTGWFITLGRGLDIYQPCDLKNAFLFTSRVPAQRKCKPFTVSYNRISVR